jgi:hypothetical protein
MKRIMETDLSSADPVQGAEINFNGLRPDPYADAPPQQQEHYSPEEDDRTMLPPSHPPPQDYMYYAPPPHMQQPHISEHPAKPVDIFSNMDRTTWVLLTIAFVVGFFIGRGMIQPVILRGGSH